MKNVTPENVPQAIFEENLKEFSSKLSFVIALETSGKLSPEEAYKRIKIAYKTLKATKRGLLGEKPSTGESEGGK